MLNTQLQSPTNTYKVIPTSQYLDIADENWKHRSCGIVSLFMAMSWYNPDLKKDFISELIQRGLDIGAYIENIGWSHKGLVNISKQYGFDGQNYDYFKESDEFAFSKLTKFLENGPVIVSIYSQYGKQSKDGHLLVIYGYEINDKEVTFLIADPDSQTAENILYKVTKEKLINGWKRRFITIWKTQTQ